MTHYKYPRTPHLPWSEGKGSREDLVLLDTSHFEGKQVVVTVKMDGENTSIYKDHIHARSLDYKSHPSRDALVAWAKNTVQPALWLRDWQDIRVCLENCYAKHSIHYTHLENHFLVHSLWWNILCYSWETTCDFCDKHLLTTVPVLYKGIYNEPLIKELYSQSYNGDEMEGYVIRITDPFFYNDFGRNVAKFVRSNHVQTNEHWLNQKITKNILDRRI